MDTTFAEAVLRKIAEQEAEIVRLQAELEREKAMRPTFHFEPKFDQLTPAFTPVLEPTMSASFTLEMTDEGHAFFQRLRERGVSGE